uniref:Sugar ABC transporter permease n=1 Tax=Thermofilum pendens TaxID=2269 RepID=A0A7C4B9S4_THEPE
MVGVTFSGRHVIALLFLVFVATAFFFIYALIGWNALLSFTKSRGLAITYELAGLEQYRKAAEDPVFYVSIRNNALLILLFIPGSMAVGLLLAILMNTVSERLESAFRMVFLLPFSLSFVVTGAMWAWMYNYTFGVANSLLSLLAGIRVNWLGDPDLALYSIILALIWQFSGYTALVFLAGIKSVPVEQLEAARVDGATTLQVYRFVILPQLRPWFLSSFVVLMVFALKAFDFIYVLTNGGPGVSTYVLALLMYRRAFFETDFPYGAALATILLAMVVSVVAPYLAASLRKR